MCLNVKFSGGFNFLKLVCVVRESIVELIYFIFFGDVFFLFLLLFLII